MEMLETKRPIIDYENSTVKGELNTKGDGEDILKSTPLLKQPPPSLPTPPLSAEQNHIHRSPILITWDDTNLTGGEFGFSIKNRGDETVKSTPSTVSTTITSPPTPILKGCPNGQRTMKSVTFSSLKPEYIDDDGFPDESQEEMNGNGEVDESENRSLHWVEGTSPTPTNGTGTDPQENRSLYWLESKLSTSDMTGDKVTYPTVHKIEPQTKPDVKPGQRTPKVHTCPWCNRDFYRKDHLTRHVLRHTGEKPYRCIECNDCFTRAENLKRHMALHTGISKFPCEICGKGFTQRFRKVAHITNDHTVDEQQNLPFECHICLGKFATGDLLEDHIEQLHNDQDFRCSPCNMNFPDELTHNLHIVNVHPIHSIDHSIFAMDDGPKVGSAAVDPIAHHHTMKFFGCEQCPKVFTRKDHLNRHMIVHSNIKPFHCEFCGREFGRKDNKMKHVKSCVRNPDRLLSGRMANGLNLPQVLVGRTIKPDDPLYMEADVNVEPTDDSIELEPDSPDRSPIKTECDDEFDDYQYDVKPMIDDVRSDDDNFSYDLKPIIRHFAGVPTKEYTCPVCDKIFIRVSAMKRHMVSHSEERKFMCDLCSIAFKRRDHALKHMLVHRPKMGTYNCDRCTINFEEEWLQMAHYKTVHVIDLTKLIKTE